MTKPKSKMSLAEQIVALHDPAPSYDPEDAEDEDTRAQLVEFEDEISEGVEKVRPSKLRSRAAGLLAEDDKRYAGRTTSRKDFDVWEDDAVHSQEEDEHFDNVISSGGDQMIDYTDDATSDDDQSDIEDEKHVILTRNIEDLFKKIKDELDTESLDCDDDEPYITNNRKRKDTTMEDGIEDGIEDDDNDQIEDNEDDDGGDDDDDDDDDDDEDDDDEEEEDDSSDVDGDDEDYYSNKDTGNGMQAFSDVSISEEVAKGKATKTQLTLWDAFMENRIKIQKALAIANQLPSYNKQASFIQEGGQVIRETLHSSSLQLKTLLKKLIDLQQALLLGNQVTRQIVEGRDAGDEDSHEELTSSDDDVSKDDSTLQKAQQMPASKCLKRKPDISDLGEFLAKRHKDFESLQYDTIQKWHDKTKLATGKQNSKSFSSFEKSAVSQIHQVLQDKPRLIKRTQLRRTMYRRLGDAEETDDAMQSKETEDASLSGNSHLRDFDEETFDDDDFYHQLIRELIDKRTSSASDPVQLTRQWLEVQKLRRKIKKKVDTKASKGRKIRYDVHPQLVSFMAGRDTGRMMDNAKNELFGSLFGRKRNTTEDVH